jgi:uncharacterized protein (TIGR00299 family) protein
MRENLHIHLDPMGGISGDMFIAAMIDADPSLKTLAKSISLKIIKDIELTIKKSSINHISGTKFSVKLLTKKHNHHRTFNDIKKLIEKSVLEEKVKEISINIFHELAIAESQIHAVSIKKVFFHEIGAWDSIIDNIIAAAIIHSFASKHQITWSCSPIPLGKGNIKTAHGLLSIPALATSILLKNIPVIDDGIEGERTTPTGAAILSVIKPLPDIASANKRTLSILKQGIGIGNKDLKTIPNILRVLIFKEAKNTIKNTLNEVISEINFDIDDQSPEDLALSLDSIAKKKGVLDIIQNPILGKKGRVSINVKILCRVEKTNKIIELVFNETNTIGLRHSIIGRFILNREINKISYFNIKSTLKPSGKITKKVESNGLKNYSYKNRMSIKSKMEKK